jgi:hypothetical protein
MTNCPSNLPQIIQKRVPAGQGCKQQEQACSELRRSEEEAGRVDLTIAIATKVATRANNLVVDFLKKAVAIGKTLAI